MPSRQTVAKFIALVKSGAQAEAIVNFYAADASTQENGHPPRRGFDTLIAHERAAIASIKNIQTLPAQSVLVDGDKVAGEWFFHETAQRKTPLDA